MWLGCSGWNDAPSHSELVSLLLSFTLWPLPHGRQWHFFEKESQTVTPVLRIRARTLTLPPGLTPACPTAFSPPFTSHSLLNPHFAPASQVAFLISPPATPPRWLPGSFLASCRALLKVPFYSESCLATSLTSQDSQHVLL